MSGSQYVYQGYKFTSKLSLWHSGVRNQCYSKTSAATCAYRPL